MRFEEDMPSFYGGSREFRMVRVGQLYLQWLKIDDDGRR
jgi:hypothetical protein